ncbi:tetratricopeptide repeat protein [Pseudonocardia asaccharolytica]|uniref:Tetratricopeptide repeat protein n=1 Tax=Pseudonocardia asaccharolytica DSM 44247 = NBRC 16224 TaxID=1123024 RepID=A0A511D5H1_9PSEU|nr:tetratricopeptide repeat protein [Pseudonocardia asaccharolytica]GEL19897.1 hypothetical protein PA7_37340 [Pseudonocardia asaccharolytica DSM 44247 = NBRC 16224]
MADTTTAPREDLPARPQPLGALPLPTGFLLVPAGPDTEEARIELLAGRAPHVWPDRLRGHELALRGDLDGALAALSGTDPVSRFNRFVIDPDGEDVEPLRAELGEFGVLVDLVLFTTGRSELPPEPGASDGELAALVLSAQATHALGRGEHAAAVESLDRAAELVAEIAPPLAGVLLGAAAAAAQEVDGVGPAVVDRLERAVRVLGAAESLRVGRAELHVALALALHELAGDRPDQLNRAIPHYHSALQLVRCEDAPQVWAAAHANLASAYLTMPMTEVSDQLRMGVAVQSLRAALTVYTRDAHPEQWASTQLNLANSLVYTPSRHQGDNLVEAVELYESLLEVRSRDVDPVGRARVLANQGNVLAHLGMFDQAKAKLYEARFIFEEFSDGASVRAVRGVLDEIARQSQLLRSQG